jgi:putative ABC transport system permease protein
VRTQDVSPGYFRALGIAMLAGRDFANADRPGSPQVAIINETVARHYFPGVNPVGKRLGWSRTKPKDFEIIGVVKDAKYESLRQETPRMVYMPVSHEGRPNYLQIRTAANSGRPPFAIMADCRAAIREINSDIRITAFRPLTQIVSGTLAPERLVSWLSAGFGLVALLLTSVGLYGILAYTVARRTSEFGIRLALGAGRISILKMVMNEGLMLAAIGLAVGFAAAAPLSHLMASLLFGVEPHDTITFAAAAVALMLVAVAASYGPARRATAVEPLTALRYE